MFRVKHKKLLSRGINLLLSLVIGVIVIEDLLKPGKAVAVWMTLVCLVIAGGVFFVVSLELRGQRPANRWYRAAYWAAWILCLLLGALLISAAVAWGITGPTVEQFPVVSSVLLITAQIGGLVGIFVVGGLAIIGYIAQGTEETRQWVRSRGRRNGEVREETTTLE